MVNALGLYRLQAVGDHIRAFDVQVASPEDVADEVRFVMSGQGWGRGKDAVYITSVSSGAGHDAPQTSSPRDKRRLTRCVFSSC